MRAIGGGSFIAKDLLVVGSTNSIDGSLYSVSKEEVVAGQARYLFCTRYPYRGTPTTVIYCYEMVPVHGGEWLLRGYLPINICDVNETNLMSSREISYVTDGQAVRLLCNGSVLFTVNSVAEILYKKSKFVH